MVYLDYAATCPKVKYPCSNYGSFFNVNANYAYKEKRLLSEAEDRVKKAMVLRVARLFLVAQVAS